jgi:hypothetical protein
MFGINTLKSVFTPLVTAPTMVSIERGDIVELHDGRVGIVDNWGLSPFFAEEMRGEYRLYVVSADYDFEQRLGDFWTDYVPAEAVKFVVKTQGAEA